MTLNIRTDRRLISKNGCRRLVLCTITAPPRQRDQQRASLELAIALDRSGSMQGEKLELAQQALTQTIAALDVDDRIGVVAFNHSHEVVLEPTAGGAGTTEIANDMITSIYASGGTDLHGGWDAARKMYPKIPCQNVLRRCILVTDGQATVGMTDHQSLKAFSEHLREQHISTSAFGIGDDFDERTLSKIADGGGGSFQYIPDANGISAALEQELGEACAIIARDVDITFDIPHQAKVELVGDWPHQHNDHSLVVELPDLGANQELTIGLIVDVEAGTDQLQLAAHVDWVLAEGPNNAGDIFQWQVSDSTDIEAEKADLAVVDKIMQLRAAAARIKALDMHDEGDYDKASQHLADMAQTMNTEYGHYKRTQQKSRDMLRESHMMSRQLTSDMAKQTRHRSWSMTKRSTEDGRTQLGFPKEPPADDSPETDSSDS